MHDGDALAALRYVAEHGGGFRLDELSRRFGSRVDELLAEGLLAAADDPRTVICRTCGALHEVRVVYDHAAKGWRYPCLGDGVWVAAEERALRAAQFDPVRFWGRVAGALGVEGTIRERVSGSLWLLGDVCTQGVAWTAMGGQWRDDNEFHAVLAHLPTVSKRPGLVLAASPIARHFPLIAGHRIVPVWDHLDVEASGSLCIREAGVLAALGRDRPGAGRGGRPTAKADIVAFVARLQPDRLNRPIGELLAELRAWLPVDVPAAKDATLKKHLRRALQAVVKNAKT